MRFKSHIITLLLVLVVSFAVNAKTTLNCHQALQEAISLPTNPSLVNKFYLTETDSKRINEISQAKQSGWQRATYEVYREARLRNLEALDLRRDYLLGFEPETALNLEGFRLDSDKVALPLILKGSILSWIVTAHELEHRIQFSSLLMGTKSKILAGILSDISLYNYEIEAMRAEWEFIRSLSAEALDSFRRDIEFFKAWVLIETNRTYSPFSVNEEVLVSNNRLKSDAIDYEEMFLLMSRAGDLSFEEYVVANHTSSFGRYNTEETDSMYRQSMLRNALFLKAEPDLVESLFGVHHFYSWMLMESYDFYIDAIKRLSPVPLKITVSNYSEDIVEIKIEPVS